MDYNPSRRKVYVCAPDENNHSEDNTALLREYCRVVYDAGYSPLSLFPQFLDGDTTASQTIGMEMCGQLLSQCDALVVCGNGVTTGMKHEIHLAEQLHVPILTLDVFLPETSPDRPPPTDIELLTAIGAARTGQDGASSTLEDYGSYTVDAAADILDPGFRITIQHTLAFKDGEADISALLGCSLTELKSQRDDSVRSERTAFQNLRKAVHAWEEIGSNTLMLDTAIRYLEHPPIQHSSNHWIVDKYWHNEISNMVYKLTWRVTDHTVYDHNKQAVVTDEWYLTWSLRLNSVLENSYVEVSGHLLAGVDRMPFPDMEALTAYLDERIVECSDYFTEISPPVPRDFAAHFSVGGVLLPGYALEGETQLKIQASVIAEKPSVLEKIRLSEQTATPKNTTKKHDKNEPEL